MTMYFWNETEGDYQYPRPTETEVAEQECGSQSADWVQQQLGWCDIELEPDLEPALPLGI